MRIAILGNYSCLAIGVSRVQTRESLGNVADLAEAQSRRHRAFESNSQTLEFTHHFTKSMMNIASANLG